MFWGFERIYSGRVSCSESHPDNPAPNGPEEHPNLLRAAGWDESRAGSDGCAPLRTIRSTPEVLPAGLTLQDFIRAPQRLERCRPTNQRSGGVAPSRDNQSTDRQPPGQSTGGTLGPSASSCNRSISSGSRRIWSAVCFCWRSSC